MASVGTEPYSPGLCRGAETPQPWAQARRQVKPIWRLEQRPVGTPGEPGLPSPAGLPRPAPLCGPPQPPADPAGATLLYRRASLRPKPYQRLEAICLRSGPGDARTLPVPGRSPPLSCPPPPAGAMGERTPRLPPPGPPTHPYKPLLNPNSFLRPHSARAPSRRTPESRKPPTPPATLPPAPWAHPGATGDGPPCPAEPEGGGASSERGAPPSPSAARRPPSLGSLRPPELPEGPRVVSREIRLTEAVRRLAGRGFGRPGFEPACLLDPGSPRNPWGGTGSRWKPPLQDPAPGADGPRPPPAKLPSVADVALRISSVQLGGEARKTPWERGTPAAEDPEDAGPQPGPAESEVLEDAEEELADGLGDDGLGDGCSQDEEEGSDDSEDDCSSASFVSPSGSVAVISRSCMEALTQSQDKVVRAALTSSLFPNVPPTLYFGTRDERVEKLPWEQRKLLRWKMSTVTPNIVKQTIGRSHFKVSKKNDDWLGCWGHHMKSPSFKTLREHQKLNHFPGSFQIGRKDRLWRNLSRMQSRHGRKEFDFFPQSFILPQDAKPLRQAWEDGGGRHKWIVKPPASARGIGIQVIHKWSQLPKRRPLLVQRYLHKPYLISGSKFDLRVYVYVTSYDPLRVYLFTDGLVRFASCKYSPSMKSLGNKFMHLTNYSVNRKNAEYKANADQTACQGHKWALKALWAYLNQKGVNSEAIWEKIKDIVVKTIIASEPYVTNLLKMYVRRAYSCHELFGFDIMLDENLKPWVLEVNISPSLHSNSPLDVSVKGQMIRDLLNLAGFVLPHAEDRSFPSDGCGGSTASPPSPAGAKDRLGPEYFMAEKLKRAHFLMQKLPDQELYSSVLDVLTPGDVRVLVETEDEFSRRGQFERVFPTRASARYLRFFDQPRYFNILTTQWELKYHGGDKLRGVDLLRRWCFRGFHTGAGSDSDSAPVWTLPRSHLLLKGDSWVQSLCTPDAGKPGKPPDVKEAEDGPPGQALPLIKTPEPSDRPPAADSEPPVPDRPPPTPQGL
ncbi:tubulin polyglutamylase TTLL4 [Tachyglossus aculeatus]|uniref:tubulin polyglutamylase TTLL4 n=1 Tax=Tachyglossus aculeatus TaxID=9261 RepID=UPI0018F3E8E3|nr:tubulin polyglutamylase TTLL4 [Tachyglossus aculeatus]